MTTLSTDQTQATTQPLEATVTISSHDEAVIKLRELIKGIKIAVLTTIDRSDGSLHSRPMGTQEVEFDGTLYFFTEITSEKANDIEANAQVNVSYADTHGHRYVSISGTAGLITDRAKMEQYWHPFLQAWFPDGLETVTLGLIRVIPHRAEYWESDGRVKTLLKLAKALVTREEVQHELGENAQLEF